MSIIQSHNVTLYGGSDKYKIVLRPLSDEHLPYLYKWNSDPEVLYWVEGDCVESYSPEIVREIYGGISKNNLCFLVEVNGENIGECWLQKMNIPDVKAMYGECADVRRIDMCIGEKSYWGKGIGTLFVEMLVKYAFESEHVDVLHCLCEDYNIRSCRVWEKNGFTLILTEKIAESSKGNEQYHWRMTKEEYYQYNREHKMESRIKKIREQEKKSHMETYTSSVLFEQGSWLAQPIKTVVDLFPYFKEQATFRGLDLGCGIGRNCIPLAQNLKNCDCKIDCVDILDIAITYLKKYSVDYQVNDIINGVVMPIENFEIREDYYDLVLGISSLEHVESETLFFDMLARIRKGVHRGGIVCFVINSEVNEYDRVMGEKLVPQFEVNLSTEKLVACLEDEFEGWEIMKRSVVPQKYDIPRDREVHLTTNVVTWVARKYGGDV